MSNKSFLTGMLAVFLGTAMGPLTAYCEADTPFKLYHGYAIVLTGSVGPIQGMTFLLDTGAVPSVIDRRIARKLALADKPEAVTVFTRRVASQSLIVPEIRVGPVVASAVHVLAQDLSFVEERLGVRVDALIGLEVLGERSFTVDYESEKIVFGAVERGEYSHPIQTRPGFVFLTLLVSGRPFSLVVDTGAKDLILFSGRFRGRLDGLQSRSAKAGQNLGGSVTLRQVRLPAAEIGDGGPLDAYIAETSPQSDPGFDGLLGVRALGLTWLAFDFESHTITWRRKIP